MDRRRFLTGLLGTALMGPPLVRAMAEALAPVMDFAASDVVAVRKIPAGEAFWIRTFFDNKAGVMSASVEYPRGIFQPLPKTKIRRRTGMGNVMARSPFVAKSDLTKFRILQDLKLSPIRDKTIILSRAPAGPAVRPAGDGERPLAALAGSPPSRAGAGD